jgi:hypothetical protein
MKFQLPLLLALATSLSAVPSDINYQGRLTDANGDAVTGDVTMSVKMYDAQSGGNEIYSEDIGTVTLDENGVYSFQFGASGNSTVTKTETIVTSDGSSTEYTGTFTNTPIDGTISVTDETYSWNDIDGNPGEQATAYIIIINGFVIFADIENGGSGYDDDNPPLVTITGDGTGATATATVENGVVTGIALPDAGNNYTEGEIIIAPPPAPFTVDKVDGNLEVGYASSPSNGTGVVATYKTLEPSIIGALSEASSHWLELTVNGTAQNPRERILSVPFAQVAGVANLDNSKILNQSDTLIASAIAVEVLHGTEGGADRISISGVLNAKDNYIGNIGIESLPSNGITKIYTRIPRGVYAYDSDWVWDTIEATFSDGTKTIKNSGSRGPSNDNTFTTRIDPSRDLYQVRNQNSLKVWYHAIIKPQELSIFESSEVSVAFSEDDRFICFAISRYGIHSENSNLKLIMDSGEIIETDFFVPIYLEAGNLIKKVRVEFKGINEIITLSNIYYRII